MTVCSKIEEAPLSEFREADFPSCNLHTAIPAPQNTKDSFAKRTLTKLRHENFEVPATSTITYRSKGTAPLLDNWKSYMCVNLHALWQSRLTKKAQPFLAPEKVPPTGLLAQKLKRHHSLNLESQIFLNKNGQHCLHATSPFQEQRIPLCQRSLTKLKHVNLTALTILPYDRER